MKDLHCHLLFGMDDGAQTAADTEEMLKRAASSGIDVIAATSHYLPESAPHYDEVWDQTCIMAEEYGIRLLKGTEYDLDYLADIPHDQLRTLGDTKYLLVDMNRNYIVHSMPNLFFELKLAGFQIIFAHPERMLPWNELQKLLKILEENGIYIQLDSGSVCGRYGKTAQKNAFALLDRGGVHFIWNDAHKARHFLFPECRALIEKRYGSDAWSLLAEANPDALLSNGFINPLPRRPTFWDRLFHRE